MGLTFNGTELAEAFQNRYIVNAFVEHPPEFVLAEPDISYTHVPGRNGDIIYDDGSYKNVLIKYPIAVRGNVEEIGSQFANFQSIIRGLLSRWLYPAEKSADGYYTLRDSYDTTHYRKARPYGQVSIENIYGWNARGTITFDCRPERYSTIAPPIVTISPPSGTIDNTSNVFPEKPILRVRFSMLPETVSGAFAIYQTGGNMYRVQIDDAPNPGSGSYIQFDCDTQEATFRGGTSANQYITLSGVGSYPVLEPGIVQSIAITGDIGSIELIQRHYEI